MCIIALSLALLAIVAGMMLMAQTKRETLGSFFKFVSWFVVIVGFLGIICLGVHCIVMRCHHGCMMGKERMGMMDMRGGRCMDSRMNSCCNMSTGSCCGGMMGCRDGMMKGCNDGMMMKGGNDGMMGSCRDMKGDSNCHMKIKKDSVIIKKK